MRCRVVVAVANHYVTRVGSRAPRVRTPHGDRGLTAAERRHLDALVDGGQAVLGDDGTYRLTPRGRRIPCYHD